jgi:hypothetical protein
MEQLAEEYLARGSVMRVIIYASGIQMRSSAAMGFAGRLLMSSETLLKIGSGAGF